MGTMASIVVHDDASADVVDTAIDAVLVEARAAGGHLQHVPRRQRHQRHQPRRAPPARRTGRGRGRPRRVHLAGSRDRRRFPCPPSRTTLPVRSHRVRQGLGDRAVHGRARGGRARALVRLGRRRPAGPWAAHRTWIRQPTALAHRRGRSAPPQPGPRLLRPPRRRGGDVGHGRAGAPPLGRPDRPTARRAGFDHRARPPSTWADALATAAFALGDDGPDWIEGLDGYEAVAVDTRGTLRVTSGLQVVGAAA